MPNIFLIIITFYSFAQNNRTDACQSCTTCCSKGVCMQQKECVFQKILVTIALLTLGCLFLVVIIKVFISCQRDANYPLYTKALYQKHFTQYNEQRALQANKYAVLCSSDYIWKEDYPGAYYITGAYIL